MNAAFPVEAARDLVRRALDEDLGQRGDLTTRAVTPRGLVARGEVVARAPLVAAGLPLVAMTMDEMAPRGGGPVAVTLLAEDGARKPAGAPLARLEGDAAAVLGGERVLLNLLSRLSGIATLTAACVDEVAGTGCRISDTRKTTPGLRALEKYAVAVGGGENHRAGLGSMVLVKDNHKHLAGGMSEVIAALRRSLCVLADVEVEVENLAELDIVLAAGVGWVLLDNFDVATVREAVRRTAGRAKLEASGGMSPGRLRPYAEAGVQRISLGALTHGARAVDIALELYGGRR